MEGVWLFSYIVLWLVVILLTALVFLLYRQLGILYLGTAEGVSRDGLAVGVQAPDFDLSDVAGRPQKLSDYRGRRVLLLFGSPSCEPCQRLLPQLQDFAQSHALDINVLWLNDADDAASQVMANASGAAFPIVPNGGSLMDVYHVRVTPFMYMLDESGVIRVKGLANNKSWLERYLGQLNSIKR